MTLRGLVAVAALTFFLSHAAIAQETASPVQPPAGEPKAEETAEAASPYGTFSATLTGTTDYRDRGMSQTDEKPAIQGSIDWEHDSGIYAGAWASNVDFNDSHEATWELDTYVGYATEWAGFDWDVMANAIFYPGASDALDYDLQEYTLAVGRSIDIVNTKATVIYTPDNSGDSGTGVYGKFQADAPIRDTGFGVTGSFGHQYIDDKARFGVGSYNDWSLGATYAWEGVDFALQYIDTNLSKSQCPDGCSATAVLTISHKFGGAD